MSLTKVFVTGATGFIGYKVCEEFIRHNINIKILHRRESNLVKILALKNKCPERVEFYEGDLSDIKKLADCIGDADAVLHFAAAYREAKHADDYYYKVNYKGTENLLKASDLAASQFNKSPYFYHCSTTGVTGHIKTPPADETHPYGPLDVYQKSKTEAEKLVLSWLQQKKINGCVIRPTMVWGPDDTRLFKMFKGIYKRKFPVIGDGQTLCHWILVNDLAHAFYLAATKPASNGHLFIVGGERTVTLEYTMKTIADFYGVKLLPFKIPVKPIQFLGSIVEIAAYPFGIEPPLHRRRVDFFIKNRSFDCTKAQRLLEYRPTYSFEDEAQYVAKWYQDNQWLS
jgi:nucleoside-diphosphate-sugar epimerase